MTNNPFSLTFGREPESFIDRKTKKNEVIDKGLIVSKEQFT